MSKPASKCPVGKYHTETQRHGEMLPFVPLCLRVKHGFTPENQVPTSGTDG